jgi:hypothetical protein
MSATKLHARREKLGRPGGGTEKYGNRAERRDELPPGENLLPKPSPVPGAAIQGICVSSAKLVLLSENQRFKTSSGLIGRK